MGSSAETDANIKLYFGYMTGYAGSRDYVGTPQSKQKTPHISTHPTEKQTPTLSQDICAGYLLLQIVRNPHRVLGRESESVFKWDVWGLLRRLTQILNYILVI